MFTALVPTLLIVVPSAPVPNAPQFQLPKDPKAIVIEFDYAGGFTPPPKNNKPNLTITADGTVTANNRFSGDSATMRLSPAEVQELLAFIITENKFLEYDPAKVEQAVEDVTRKNGPVPQVADAPSTVVKVRTADKEHKASYYALGMAANQFKEIKPLQQLHAIEYRLGRLQAITWAGGPKVVDEYLKLVNEKLKAEYPDVAPLTRDEFRYARTIDGTMTAMFSRPDAEKKTFTNATIEHSTGNTPKVSLLVKSK